MIVVKIIFLIIIFTLGITAIAFLVFDEFLSYKRYWSARPHVSLTFKEFRSFYELNPNVYTLYDYHVSAYFDYENQYYIAFDTKPSERNEYYNWKVSKDKDRLNEAINRDERGYLTCVKKQIEEFDKNV